MAEFKLKRLKRISFVINPKNRQALGARPPSTSRD